MVAKVNFSKAGGKKVRATADLIGLEELEREQTLLPQDPPWSLQSNIAINNTIDSHIPKTCPCARGLWCMTFGDATDLLTTHTSPKLAQMLWKRKPPPVTSTAFPRLRSTFGPMDQPENPTKMAAAEFSSNWKTETLSQRLFPSWNLNLILSVWDDRDQRSTCPRLANSKPTKTRKSDCVLTPSLLWTSWETSGTLLEMPRPKRRGTLPAESLEQAT